MLLVLLACAHPVTPAAPPAAPQVASDTKVAAPPPVLPPVPLDPVLVRLQALAAAEGDNAWRRLALLTDDVGCRPSGSAAYDRAVTWAVDQWRADGVNVWTEPVTQPAWIRGTERLTMTAPRTQELAVLTLGGSVGTQGPIEAPVRVLHSFEELGPDVAGTIVVFNVPMAEGLPTVERYGDAVQYRVHGAARAAKVGARAVLVRSVTTRSLYTPHTGATFYADDAPKIPTASITAEDADQIDRLVARGIPVTLRLDLGARSAPDVASAQVLGEIRGSERPEEIVLIGGHLDSWDVGQGAQDDGAGVIEVMETLRLLQRLGVAPKRTVRGVLYANEEFGLSGGKAYAAAHGADHHVAAMESDLGAGAPVSWSAQGSPAQLSWLRQALTPLGLPVEEGGGGADISTLEPSGTLLVGFRPDDSRYFDIHHTEADTIDKVDPAVLRAAVATVATYTWLVANAPDAPPLAPEAVHP